MTDQDAFDAYAEMPTMPEGGFDFPFVTDPPVMVDEAQEKAPLVEEIDRLAELVFDGRHQNDFEGLMFLGRLSTTYNCLGHDIVINTLTVDELLKVGLMTKEYQGTVSSDRAYITAIVAMCVESVDGKPLISPLGPGTDIERAKFNYVKENWYFWTSDLIYQEFRALELRVQEIVDAMGEASS